MKQKKPDTVYMCSMITYVGSSQAKLVYDHGGQNSG